MYAKSEAYAMSHEGDEHETANLQPDHPHLRGLGQLLLSPLAHYH